MGQTKQVTAVGAFIFDRENRIFLAKFAQKFEKLWSIPGGKIDFGEEPLQAVQREVQEETNISIEIEQFHYFDHGSFLLNGVHVIYLDYIAECPEHFEVRVNEEFTDFGFYHLDALENLDIIPKSKETALKAFRWRSQNEWVRVLSSFQLGLIRKTLCLHPQQTQWQDAFKWVQGQILQALKHNPNYQLHHIGSTNIEGLVSKPVLDVLLEFADAAQFEKDIAVLEQLGFLYRGDGIGRLDPSRADPLRHTFNFFNKEENIDYVHLHALPKGHPHAKDLLLFHKRLSANPLLRQHYQELKLSLQAGGIVRKRYTLEKDAFVTKLLR